MGAPRLRVGGVGAGELTNELERVGHLVTYIEDLDNLPDCDLIVLDCPASFFEHNLFIPEVKRGQMVVHTALEVGVQVLDELEVQGAIVMAAHRVWKNFWAVGAADEVGESVISLLINEIGGNVTFIDDHQRPPLAAGQRLRALTKQVRLDSYHKVVETIPGVATEIEEYWLPDGEPKLDRLSTNLLEKLYNAIEDPAVADTFAALERRYAIAQRVPEVELWATGKLQR